MSTNRVILIILDGWGKGRIAKADAIHAANTPFVDSLYEDYPNSELITHGEQVGLPDEQMGNSEVGHLNIGAGRVVYQELARINKAILDGDFHKNPVLIDALNLAKARNSAVHFMGLVSDGGVHSHIEHLKALCDVTHELEIEKVFIHAFMDGRDTAPTGGLGYLKDLRKHIAGKSAKIATVIGRYYSMDRDNRWARIKQAYDLLVNGKGEGTKDVLKTIKQRYKRGETDEFLKPILCIDDDRRPLATLKADDVLISFNFRTDRPRQISKVLTQKNMRSSGMKTIPLHFVTMTKYDESFQNVNILYKKKDINQTLGEVISKAGMSQVRIAETEKYPHVTFFFNGGKEQEFKGERRLLIPSPKVATYDLQPEMSIYEVTDAIADDIYQNQPDFICLNFANADMVGHTGVFDAAVKAVEIVDKCLKSLMNIATKSGYEAIIIADHGNSDYMINRDGSPNTAHTKNPVPCFYVGKNAAGKKLKNGKLGDIAPTILHLLGLEVPEEMTGENLIENIDNL